MITWSKCSACKPVWQSSHHDSRLSAACAGHATILLHGQRVIQDRLYILYIFVCRCVWTYICIHRYTSSSCYFSFPGEFNYLSCHHLCFSLWTVNWRGYRHWSCLWLARACHCCCCGCVSGCACGVQIPWRRKRLIVS